MSFDYRSLPKVHFRPRIVDKNSVNNTRMAQLQKILAERANNQHSFYLFQRKGKK